MHTSKDRVFATVEVTVAKVSSYFLETCGFMQVSQPKAIKRGRHALFVLYSWNYDALLTAARCSHASALFSCPLMLQAPDQAMQTVQPTAWP